MKQPNTIVDGWLVLQFRNGDAKALNLLVKRWHKVFCNKAFWVTRDRDRAKDIAQDSWKVILAKLHTLQDVNRFGSWGLTIVHRKAIDSLRTKNREMAKLKAYQDSYEPPGEEEPADNSAIKRRLLEAILGLPDDQRSVINLFYVEEYSLRQISEILDISVGTAKSRLFHAREKLKLILKHKDHENEYGRH